MIKHNAVIINSISALIALLFVYTSFSKLIDFEAYKMAMYSQPLPRWMSTSLIYLLPTIEITISILLFTNKLKYIGMLGSMLLMALFTIYISLILLRYFKHIPCSCGGLIQGLTWKQHLFLNSIFFIFSCIGYIINYKNISRAKSGKKKAP